MLATAQESGVYDFDPSRFVNRRWTYDDLSKELPETKVPIELWDGEFIMSPSPSFFHQRISDRFHDFLKAWIRPRQLGETVAAPMDMVLTQRNVTQPDVLFIGKDRLHVIQDRIRGPADLVLEIISEGSRHRDRIEKRDLYEQHGVREYWIADPDAETVEVLFLETGEYRLVGRWRPGESARSKLLEGFSVDVAALFAPLRGTR